MIILFNKLKEAILIAESKEFEAQGLDLMMEDASIFDEELDEFLGVVSESQPVADTQEALTDADIEFMSEGKIGDMLKAGKDAVGGVVSGVKAKLKKSDETSKPEEPKDEAPKEESKPETPKAEEQPKTEESDGVATDGGQKLVGQETDKKKMSTGNKIALGAGIAAGSALAYKLYQKAKDKKLQASQAAAGETEEADSGVSEAYSDLMLQLEGGLALNECEILVDGGAVPTDIIDALAECLELSVSEVLVGLSEGTLAKTKKAKTKASTDKEVEEELAADDTVEKIMESSKVKAKISDNEVEEELEEDKELEELLEDVCSNF